MPLNILLFQIQVMLYVGSCLLLAGSLAGIYMKSRFLSEGSASFLSARNENSEAGEDACREKRRARRLRSGALLELMDPSGGFMADSARLRDISIKGACFESPVLMKLGHRIEARLHSSKEGLLRISARIIWLRPKNNRIFYGVEFDAVHPSRP